MKKIMESFLQGGTMGLGLLFVLIVGGVTYAAWNDDVNSGDPLTPARWNDLVAQVESISFPVGMVAPFGGSSCPTGWVAANGALLPLSTYPTLAALLGTTYGGNGLTNYALPDLRGRTAVGSGIGPGLSAYTLGQRLGSEARTLTVPNLPAHSHSASATLNAHFVPPTGGGGLTNPNGNLLSGNGDTIYSDQAANVQMSASAVNVTVNNTGGSQAFDIRQPLVAMNYCIYTGN